jgi:hypothetical protein
VEPISVTDDQQRVLQAAYEGFRQLDDWTTFGRIDRPLRRPGCDPAALIRSMPTGLLMPWRGSGVEPLHDDPMRLTLLGMSLCAGSQEDIEGFLFMTRWSAEREAQFEPDDNHALPQLTSADVAARLRLAPDDTGPIKRLWAMLMVQRWGFGSGGGTPMDWHFDIERDVQRFAHVQTVADYMDARAAWVQETTRPRPSEVAAQFYPNGPGASLADAIAKVGQVARTALDPSVRPPARSEASAVKSAFAARYRVLQQSTAPRKRGIAFEQLWRDVLEFYGWEPRKTKIPGEENDFTAVYKTWHILGEVRWFQPPMTGSKVRDFLNKLQRRPNTIGLFISMSGFDKGALSVLRRSNATVVRFDAAEIDSVLLRGADPGPTFEVKLRDAYDYLGEAAQL